MSKFKTYAVTVVQTHTLVIEADSAEDAKRRADCYTGISTEGENRAFSASLLYGSVVEKMKLKHRFLEHESKRADAIACAHWLRKKIGNPVIRLPRNLQADKPQAA